MSDTDKDAQPGACVAPIVLVIGNQDTLGYLDNNAVLKTLYGDRAPERYTIPCKKDGWIEGDVAWELFYLYKSVATGGGVHSDDDRKFKLLERFGNISSRELDVFLKSVDFYAAVYEYIKTYTGISNEDAPRVRVIICDEDMLKASLPLTQVARSYFPEATFLVVSSVHGAPKRFVPEEVPEAEA